MNNTGPRLWSFYAGDAASMLSGGYIALARPDTGDLAALPRERDEFRTCFPDIVEANLLYRFAHELREGDCVLLRTGHGNPVDIGRVSGPYAFTGGEHRRSVRWLRRMPPADISSGALREITYASASQLFEVRRYTAEFLEALGLCQPPVPVNGTPAERFAARWSLRRSRSA